MGSNKLALLRMGQRCHKIITVREQPLAVVMLTAAESRRVNEDAEIWARQNRDRVNEMNKESYLNCLLAFNSLRDPDNMENKIADYMEELIGAELRNDKGEVIVEPNGNGLTIQEIQNIVEAYGELALDSVPTPDLLTEDEFEELKKVFEGIRMSDLRSVSLVHLANFRASLMR